MTQCVVRCHHSECATRTGHSRRWKHLCEDCAQSQLEAHRRATGHTNIELAVVTDITDDSIRSRRQASRAYWAARRLGVVNG